MNKGLMIALLLLTFSQYAIAQATIADIREQIAKGECETAQSLYNVYKAMNGANKTIEREIDECKSEVQDLDFYLQKARQRIAEGDCSRAETSYNTYKDLTHKTNSELERLIEECKSGGSNSSVNDSRTGFANGHEYVDLGLPSGTLWATCNIGTSSPEGYGNYYAWGETGTKSTYNWDTYRYSNSNNDELTKYCNRSDQGNNGFTDNLTTLQAGDDPATVNWGSGWQTPSKAQWEELKNNTTHKWTMRNGKQGRLFTAQNGQSVFLPAAGTCWDSEFYDAGSYGRYWSRSLYIGYPHSAWCLYFDLDDWYMGYGYRYYGFSVRPVREK